MDPLRDGLHVVTPPAGGEPWGPPPEQGAGDDDTRPLQQARLPRQPGGPEQPAPWPETHGQAPHTQRIAPLRPAQDGPQPLYAEPQPLPGGPQSPHPGPQSPHPGPQSPHPGPQSSHPGPQPSHVGPQSPHAGPQPPHPGSQPVPPSDPQPLPSYGPGPEQPPQPQQPPAPAWPAPGADEAATELIAPITADSPPPYDLDGAPPAQPYGMPYEEPAPRAGRHGRDDFAALYRDSAPAADPGATQQMPRVPAAPAPAYEQPHGPGGHDQGPGGAYYDDESRRSIPRWAMVALATAACVAVGLTAGWLMSSSDSGGDDGGKQAAHSPTAAASEAHKSSAPPPDPAKEQAKKLDALLANSNNSRSAVVRSVAKIRACHDLSKAAADLRGAARQRNDLVTRLSGLPTDKLPNHARLTASLSAAWKASASADSHYAAWASQMARGHHGCHHGGARPTDQSRAADRASGTATQNKRQAASLWNPIARKYDLTTRQPTQL